MYVHLKRVLDFLLSLLALAVLSPLLFGLAVAVKATSPGPVFFRQKRVGKGKTHFMIYKFRTMRTDAPKDQPTHLLQNPEAFITPVGRFLRRSSLDELPQLINILKGEMAVVGPRPALWNQFDLIAERDKYGANDLRPGLTGWAQINGRDELPIDVKARLDGEYVRRMSLGFDARCVLGTVLSVVRAEGVVEGAQATDGPFVPAGPSDIAGPSDADGNPSDAAGPSANGGKPSDAAPRPARPGRMNRAFLTVDLEEWYHLDYLKGYHCRESGVRVLPQLFDFLDMLDDMGVKVTFFCVAEIAAENAGLLREILRRGHALGCHGLDHDLLSNKSLEQFVDETRRAREMIEAAAGRGVTGYRAPCFTMERDKLEALRALGFTYDSSKIRFAQHPLYRNLELDGFERPEDLVYRDGDFTEYEIPTLELFGYSIPISGGGYLRLFPFWLLRLLLALYARKHENFTIYAHPFELTAMPLPLPKGLGRVTRFRCLVGRKRNLKKLRKVIRWLKKRGARFITLEQDRRERGLT